MPSVPCQTRSDSTSTLSCIFLAGESRRSHRLEVRQGLAAEVSPRTHSAGDQSPMSSVRTPKRKTKVVRRARNVAARVPDLRSGVARPADLRVQGPQEPGAGLVRSE